MATPAATLAAQSAWLFFAVCPGICLALHWRDSSSRPGPTLALLLLAWLFTLLAATVFVAVGLCLPFLML
jgi:hypothetical protein